MALAFGANGGDPDPEGLTEFLNRYVVAEENEERIASEETKQYRTLKMALGRAFIANPPPDDHHIVEWTVHACIVAIEAHPDGRKTHDRSLGILKAHKALMQEYHKVADFSWIPPQQD